MKKLSKKAIKYFKEAVRGFLVDQAVFKNMEENFKNVKIRFYEDMDEYFESGSLEDDGSAIFNYPDLGEGALKVTKVQRTSVDFEADKLEKVLPKEIAKKAIVKKYEIIDIQGLTSYLKKCNVDPKIFKEFLSVTKTVDTKELDKLEELGQISIEQIKGCYTVKKSSPYYTVSEIKK